MYNMTWINIEMPHGGVLFDPICLEYQSFINLYISLYTDIDNGIKLHGMYFVR